MGLGLSRAHAGRRLGARAREPGAAHGQRSGRRAPGLLPLRGQNNVQGNADMGAMPDAAHRLPAASRTRPCARASPRSGAPSRRAGAGRTMPEMLDAAAARRAARALGPGRGRRAERPEPDARARGARAPRAARRAGAVPHRDGAPRAPRASRPRACSSRTARSPTPSAACSACAPALPPPGEARPDWQVIRDAAQRARPRLALRSDPREVMDEIARVGARALRRRPLRPPRRRRPPVAVPDAATIPGTATPARGAASCAGARALGRALRREPGERACRASRSRW